MSNQTNFTQSRRNFLKGTAAASALSVVGLPALALANKGISAVDPIAAAKAKIQGETGIKVVQETLFDREKVTLINQSGKLQMLDARQPISLYQANGKLVVTVNQDKTNAVNGMILISPDQPLSFDVKAVGIDMSGAQLSEAASNHTDFPALTNIAENELQITSKVPEFNRVVPVQVV